MPGSTCFSVKLYICRKRSFEITSRLSESNMQMPCEILAMAASNCMFARFSSVDCCCREAAMLLKVFANSPSSPLA